MLKNGDKVIVTGREQSNGIYYNIGDKGIVIKNLYQESIEVEFDSKSLNPGRWVIKSYNIKKIGGNKDVK